MWLKQAGTRILQQAPILEASLHKECSSQEQGLTHVSHHQSGQCTLFDPVPAFLHSSYFLPFVCIVFILLRAAGTMWCLHLLLGRFLQLDHHVDKKKTKNKTTHTQETQCTQTISLLLRDYQICLLYCFIKSASHSSLQINYRLTRGDYVFNEYSVINEMALCNMEKCQRGSPLITYTAWVLSMSTHKTRQLGSSRKVRRLNFYLFLTTGAKTCNRLTNPQTNTHVTRESKMCRFIRLSVPMWHFYIGCFNHDVNIAGCSEWQAHYIKKKAWYPSSHQSDILLFIFLFLKCYFLSFMSIIYYILRLYMWNAKICSNTLVSHWRNSSPQAPSGL